MKAKRIILIIAIIGAIWLILKWYKGGHTQTDDSNNNVPIIRTNKAPVLRHVTPLTDILDTQSQVQVLESFGTNTKMKTDSGKDIIVTPLYQPPNLQNPLLNQILHPVVGVMDTDDSPTIDPLNNPQHNDNDIMKYFSVVQETIVDTSGNVIEEGHPKLEFAGRELFPIP